MKKQILAAMLIMGNLIAGCGGSDDVTETPKANNSINNSASNSANNSTNNSTSNSANNYTSNSANNYTKWASLLHDRKGNSTATLKDGRTIIGYRGPKGELVAIVALPSSYSSNLKEFKIDENSTKNGFLITLNKIIEDKPKVVLYLPNPNKLNKEEIQYLHNQFELISYTENSENPVNIPVEVVQASEGKYLLEFSLLGSGEYIFNTSQQQ